MTPAFCWLTSVSLGVSCELTSDHLTQDLEPRPGPQVLAGIFPIVGAQHQPRAASHPRCSSGNLSASIKATEHRVSDGEERGRSEQ